jgi:hypothetical protein
MRFFSCSVCKEKDARISDLKDQIRLLSSLSIPDNATPSLTHLEADAVLSATQHQIVLDDEDFGPSAAERAERDRLLSGTYE